MNKRIVSPSEQLLSRRAVAHRWQTSVETVKRREKEGLIKAIRFNQRLLRYRLSDVEQVEAAAAEGAK
jgi:predicted site-specific integrase-resolvase